MSRKLPNPKMVKSLTKYSREDMQAIIFKMRHLIIMPKETWTQAERKWWSSVNIGLGQLISDIDNANRKEKKK